MIKYFSLVFIAGDLLSFTLSCPFLWNTPRQTLQLSTGPQYRFYRLVGVILFAIALIISLRIGNALFLDSFNMFGLISPQTVVSLL